MYYNSQYIIIKLNFCSSGTSSENFMETAY